MNFLNNLLGKARSYLGGKLEEEPLATDAIKHDRYDAALWRDVLDEIPPINDLVVNLNQQWDYTEDLVRDTMMQFWQSMPELRTQAEMDPRFLLNHAVATDVKAAPETAEGRQYSLHDKYGAAMMTVAAGKRIEGYLKKNKELADEQKENEKKREEEQGADEDLNNLCAQAGAAGGDYNGEGPLTEEQQALADALAQALQQAQDAQQARQQSDQTMSEQAGKAQMELKSPIRQAIKETKEKLDEEQSLFSAWGVDDGELKQMDYKTRAELARLLKSNRLNQFRDLLGRYRLEAAAMRVRKVEYARDQVVGVELGDELARVVPSELAMLASGDEDLELLFLNKVVEQQLLVRKFEGTEKIGKGAVIVLVDCSSSMGMCDAGGNTREAMAKAFTLALLDSARFAKRDFVVINFSSAGQQRMWKWPKGQADIREVMQWAEHFFDGGTNYERPLDMAIKVMEQDFNDRGRAKADLVLVTDDACRVTPDWQAKYLKTKEHLDFRTFGIAVGLEASGTLEALSDNVRSVLEFADPKVITDILKVI